MQRYGAVYFQMSENGSAIPVCDADKNSANSQKDAPGLALKLAGDFSPWVEQVGENLVVMDLSGLGRQWPDEEALARAIVEKFEASNLRAKIAISSNRTTARLAACGTAGICIIPAGREKEFLAPLRLELLEPPIEVSEVFDRWGLKTLGDLSGLPEKALTQRVGKEGMDLYRQAWGKDAAPLLPHTPVETFEEFYVFDWPLENCESLSFTLNHLLDRLCRRLDCRSLVAEAVGLSMNLADRSENARHLRFGFPLNDAAAILSLLRLDLEARPPQAAVESLLLRLYPAPPRPMQFSLVEPPMIAPEKLARTLARLCALVGEQKVGSPSLLNTHRPDAFEMKPFELRMADGGLRNGTGKFNAGRKNARHIPPSAIRHPPSETSIALRIFRPSLPARVRVEGLRPIAVEASIVSGKIIECGGPWRTSGDWWEKDRRWAWDEWDVQLSSGQLYRIYRDLGAGEWFIFGAYD